MVRERRLSRQINSAFATLDINYDGLVCKRYRKERLVYDFKQRQSIFFYGAVSTSLVITDMMKKLWGKNFGRFITFAKVRASYAGTGNSLDPFQLYNSFLIDHDPNGNIIATNNGTTLHNPNVRSENLQTYEAGLNLHFFDRVDLDVNYYDTHATFQLIDLPMNPLSGYEKMKINAGDIGNKGVGDLKFRYYQKKRFQMEP